MVVTGATATGKSALALAVAARIGAEIVSADSRQVYRYMDIGTAKPTLAERAAVPHHLVDTVYPDEPFSIADYMKWGDQALTDIAARGRVALLVGGSPHYVQALVDRLRPAPQDLALRTWLEHADTIGPPGRLDRWLRTLDPKAAAAIEPRNRRRVLRAIEVTLITGRPFSQAGRERAASRPAIWIGLHLDRPTLHDRVERRLHAMLEAGWLEEVRTLLAMGYTPKLPSMSATGYRDLSQVLDGTLALPEAIQQIRRATHAFIRRQETWLRAEARITWLDAARPDLVDAAMQAISSNAAEPDRRADASGQ